MMDLLFLSIILSPNSLSLGETAKCDQQIIDNIKTIWGVNIPKDIIKTAVDNGKEVVVGTPVGYYPDDTKCLYSIFHSNSFSYTIVPEEGCPISNESTIEEMEGGTYQPDTKVRRYHVYYQDGVTGFYKCTDCGESGDPEGLVKVRASKFDETLVSKAKDVLKGLGILIIKDYPRQCP